MKKRKKGNDEEDRFTIETSLEISYLSESNEVKFIIYHDKRPAITVHANLESIFEVIKRHFFESSESTLKILEGLMKLRELERVPPQQP